LAVKVEPFLWNNLTLTPLVSANQKNPFGDISDAITPASNVIILQNVEPFVIVKLKVNPLVQVRLASAPLSPSLNNLRLIVGRGV
jgi:hypothetical protein